MTKGCDKRVNISLPNLGQHRLDRPTGIKKSDQLRDIAVPFLGANGREQMLFILK
jgi:hypothetical protein